MSVDVIRQLEQRRKHSARLPTLHALANGLGVELTTLPGDPPAVAATGENDGPRFVAVRRAIGLATDRPRPGSDVGPRHPPARRVVPGGVTEPGRPGGQRPARAARVVGAGSSAGVRAPQSRPRRR